MPVAVAVVVFVGVVAVAVVVVATAVEVVFVVVRIVASRWQDVVPYACVYTLTHLNLVTLKIENRTKKHVTILRDVQD